MFGFTNTKKRKVQGEVLEAEFVKTLEYKQLFLLEPLRW